MSVKDFLFDTDYPIDKIIGFKTGSISMSASSTSFPTVGHGLSGFTPLGVLKWSTDPNFNVSYDELGISTVDNVALSIQTDGTTLYFFAFNNFASPVTLYYRVFFFMPPDVAQDVAATAAALDNFQLNTDYNYTKIFTEGRDNGTSATINHNLGYYPQCDIWYVRTDGKCIHLLTNEVFSSPFNPTCKIDTASVTLAANSTAVDHWYHKVYIDET